MIPHHTDAETEAQKVPQPSLRSTTHQTPCDATTQARALGRDSTRHPTSKTRPGCVDVCKCPLGASHFLFLVVWFNTKSQLFLPGSSSLRAAASQSILLRPISSYQHSVEQNRNWAPCPDVIQRFEVFAEMSHQVSSPPGPPCAEATHRCSG